MTTPRTHEGLTANGSSKRRAADRANAPDDLDGARGMPDAVTRLQSGASAAADALPGAVSLIRERVDSVAERLPAAMATARATALETAESLREMPEPTRRSLAALSIGLGIGLSVAGAPRLLAMAALTPALLTALVMSMDDRSTRRSAI